MMYFRIVSERGVTDPGPYYSLGDAAKAFLAADRRHCNVDLQELLVEWYDPTTGTSKSLSDSESAEITAIICGSIIVKEISPTPVSEILALIRKGV